MGVERVRDVDDPRLADYRDLRDGERRRRDRTFIAESRQVVRRLLGGARFRARSVLAPRCSDPLYRKAIRVSMGGTLVVPFAAAASWPEALVRLRERGFTIVALTPDGGADIAEFGTSRPVPERVALLLGAEGEGVSAAARAAADLLVAIRMAGGGHSLNVATASGIALHRFTR